MIDDEFLEPAPAARIPLGTEMLNLRDNAIDLFNRQCGHATKTLKIVGEDPAAPAARSDLALAVTTAGSAVRIFAAFAGRDPRAGDMGEALENLFWTCDELTQEASDPNHAETKDQRFRAAKLYAVGCLLDIQLPIFESIYANSYDRYRMADALMRLCDRCFAASGDALYNAENAADLCDVKRRELLISERAVPLGARIFEVLARCEWSPRTTQ